jgi:hypothetical protein
MQQRFLKEIFKLIFGEHAINHPEKFLFVGFNFISNFVIINNALAWI